MSGISWPRSTYQMFMNQSNFTEASIASAREERGGAVAVRLVQTLAQNGVSSSSMNSTGAGLGFTPFLPNVETRAEFVLRNPASNRLQLSFHPLAGNGPIVGR